LVATRQWLMGASAMADEATERRALSPCAAAMREHDPDRYLATLFAPADAREALFALYAFDHEIARVRRVVSEPMARPGPPAVVARGADAIAADRPPAHPAVEGPPSRPMTMKPPQ
jgi:phytoene/squalene synthetase